MRRFFVTNLLFVLAVNALVKPAYILGVDRAVQVQVGPAAYGLYQALVNLGLVLGVLLDFGLANYNVRLIAADPQSLPRHFPALLTVRLLLSVLYIVAVSGIALALGYRGHALLLLGGVLLIQTTAQALLFLRSCLSGLHRFKTDSLLSVADRLLMLAVCGMLLRRPGFRLEWFIAAQLGCYVAASVLGVVLLRRAAPSLRLRLSGHLAHVWNAAKASGPYALLTFLMATYLRADALLLERIAGAAEAGRYAAGYRLLEVGQMFGLTFANLLLPLFGRQLAEDQSVRPLVGTSVNLLLPPALLVAVLGVFFGPDIMQALYHRNDAASGRLLAILLAAFPAFCLTNVYSTLLTAAGGLRRMNAIAAVGCVANLSLNAWLIPRLGATGAAWAALATQWLVASAYLFGATAGSKLAYQPRRVLTLVFFTGLCVAAAFAATRGLQAPWMVQAIAVGGAALAGVFALRLVSFQGLRQLLRR